MWIVATEVFMRDIKKCCDAEQRHWNAENESDGVASRRRNLVGVCALRQRADTESAKIGSEIASDFGICQSVRACRHVDIHTANDVIK
jgi:hypothetical protein